MGLAGGPHCIAMCGGACAGIGNHHHGTANLIKFHAGRLIGYSSLGAIAASSARSLAWISSQALALHPLWTFFHVLVLSWGLILLTYARQPLWVSNLGKNIWVQVRQFSQLPGGIFTAGLMWSLMPCGLLYSALLVAALNPNLLGGAFSMAAFAIATSISLFVGPWLWLKLKNGGKWITESRGMRIAGFLLSLAASWAISMDLMPQIKAWCN